jgi:hypothetical protein
MANPATGKAPSDTPAFKPYRGKPAVRNFRGGDGNVGIIRSPVRAIVSPDHTDNSLLIKYYDRPEKFLDKMAFSFTGDLGCEFGRSMTTSTGQYVQGVGCYRNTKDPNSLGQNTNASNQNTSDPISYQPGIIRRPSSM